MFPTTLSTKTQCLEALVGVRSSCSSDTEFPYWIEDIEGVDVRKLATLAKASNPSGRDFASQLINNAARQMLGDLELLLNNGYKLKEVIGDVCSTCSLLPSYTQGGGVKIKPVLVTKFSILKISRLTILANITDTKQITIDDGVTPQYFDVDLVAGTLMPVTLNYQTKEREVKIFFTDPTVPVGAISCSSNTSCGCGGSTTSNNPVIMSGLLNGVDNSVQYGFLPCVSLNCSYDSLVCNLVNQVPNVLGLALLYKVGELYYDNKDVSDRNTEAVTYNDNPQEEKKKNYGRLYWAKMKGTADMSSIKKVVNDYLKTYRSDKCIICESKVQTGYAAG